MLYSKVLQDQWTPLMYAVKEGHTEVVKVLLEQDSLEILAKNKVSMHKNLFRETVCGVLSKYYVLF